MTTDNLYDQGMQEDFNNMTIELGTEITIYSKTYSLTHEGQEGSSTVEGTNYTETASIQEIDAKHEMVASGQLDVGDLIVTLKHNTVAQEEGYIEWQGNTYKLLTLTKVRGMKNDVVTHVVARGKKVPGR